MRLRRIAMKGECTNVYVVCYTNGMPEGGLPCAVFSGYGKAIAECRRLAANNMKQKIGYWKTVHGDDKTGAVIDIFLKETGKGVAVCRRFRGKHNIMFEVENDIFYLKPFELDMPTRREWL
jgi:hypothetical protein